MRKILAGLFGVLLVTVMPTVLADEVASQVVKVSNAYVRAMPPSQRTTASYMTLVNQGKEDHQLIAAISPAALQVQLHKTVSQNGVMTMIAQPTIDLPAGQTFNFSPGGYHIMLISLTAPLTVGEKIPVYLIFNDGSHEQVTVPVTASK
ncbi:MAG: copper chaperone PCu(A)C [Gammaproteobacteria bacterium]|nr:copper chaperone PCu(A)C [Gammaproteobacteria bacterium]